MQSRQKKVLPSYQRQNRAAAAIVLADPRRHLAWPEPIRAEEIEASLMVGWARRFVEVETKTEQVSS